MFACSILSGQLEVPSGTLGELWSPLEEEAWSGTSGAEEFLSPLCGEPFFSSRFSSLVHYCGAFQNPVYCLESFCSVLCISCLFPGLLVPPPPYPSGMEAFGFLLWGRWEMQVECPVLASCCQKRMLADSSLNWGCFSVYKAPSRKSLYLVFRAAP